MTDYDELAKLVRCLRDCFGFPTETDYTCDCDNCIMRDKIEEHSYEDGEPFYTDYTQCESELALAAADAIEELMRKLNARNDMLSNVVDGLDKSMVATKDIISGGDDRIT